MAQRTSDRILRLLIERVPNYVSAPTIRRHLSSEDCTTLDQALEELLRLGRIEKEVDPRPSTGRPIAFYRPKTMEGLPVRDSLTVGDVEVPRLLSDSSPKLFPEMLNDQLECLAEYSRTLEFRFSDLVRQEQRKYWSNVVGIFGVFLSVLAMILVGLPKITTDSTLSFWSVVLLNLAQLLPIAIVLALFVLVIRWAVR